MKLWEIFLIGVGLSMDAAAISLANGMVYQGTSRRRALLMPLFFGLFQAVMPLIGYYAGSLFSGVMERYAGIATLVILGAIGGKMAYDGIKAGDSCRTVAAQLTFRVLLLQAVATSIDALAVGVSFSALKVAILPAVLLIGVTTAVISLLAILFGKRFGCLLGNRAQILGGVILVLIGLKAFIGL